MFLPRMPYAGAKNQRQIVTFGGIRYGRGGADGELEESENLSARQFPALSQRESRTAVPGYTAPTAIFGKGKLCAVDGTDLLYDGKVVGQVTAGEKQMVSVNTKVVIWPDKVFFDTASETFGTLGEKLVLAANTVTFTAKTLTVPDAAMPEGKKLADLFAANQAIEISGSSIAANNKSIIIREVTGNTMTFYDESFTEGNSTTELTIERKVPELDVICAAGNRVWGADKTTIWGSALGDPLTWYNYDGLSTDSYAVAVGTDGAFTGCCAYGSNVLFFKEDRLYKLLGNTPAEYQLYDYTVQGVQAGCGKSLQVINEVLYYKGADGVYAYTGGAPYLVSECFGVRRFGQAAAGSDGTRYYLSMQDQESKEWGLWTFDTGRRIWLREDGTHAVDFTNLDGELLVLAGSGEVFRAGQPESSGERLRWSAAFYPFDETTHGRKGYSRLLLRMEPEPGAWVKAEIREDGKPWRQAAVLHGERQRTAVLTLRPGRCDTFRVRLSGEGRCVVKSLVREFDVGSEY